MRSLFWLGSDGVKGRRTALRQPVRARSVADMPLRLAALAHDARDPARVAAFWAALLARDVVEDERGFLVPGSDTQVGLLFVAAGLYWAENPGSRKLGRI